MSATTRCPACSSERLSSFHTQAQTPVNSCLLVDTAADAVSFPRGSIELAVCHSCGFITNLDFDPALAEYSAKYEETQGFSPRFREFATSLAQRWIDRYDIHGREIVEIGCGKGEFLALMCELGGNRGTGVDPSAIPERLDSPAADRITLVPEFYGPQHFGLPADVVVCRHTLEHISPVGEFMAEVRRGIGDRTDTLVLFELPDVLRVLREGAFWDVYYEHASYFTAGSLARLFRRAGFEVLDVSLDYDDQYLLVEARPAAGPHHGAATPAEEDVQVVLDAVEQFRTRVQETVADWRKDVRGAADTGRRPVIWGGGSKGVAYLTTIGADDAIGYAVDINPVKQGKFMAGTGQQVVAPGFLATYRPGLVIVMNPVYRDEIQTELDRLGVTAELKTL